MNRLNQLSVSDGWPYAEPVVGPPSDNRRPAGQLALSLFSMFFSAVVGIALVVDSSPGFLCSTIAQPSGANITDAGALVLLTGGAAAVFAIVGRNHARFLRAVLLSEAAIVGLAIGLVARDSATARTMEDCGLFSSQVSTSTHHVQYAYVLLSLAVVVLLMQALRGWDRAPRCIAGNTACVASLALLVALVPAQAGSKSRPSAASRPPKGVLVCRAFLAPRALGGPHCDPEADVGRAPVRARGGLMCETILRGVRGKRIGIQVFYRGTLIQHATLRSSDGETSPYVYFDSNWIHGAPGSSLPAGRYRCRFLVNDTVVRSRAIAVGRRPFVRRSTA